jgi:hypothetical protein
MSVYRKIDLKDVGKGVLIAFGTVFLLGLQQTLSNGNLPTLAELGTLAIAGLAAALAYIVKNVFTNSDNKFLEKEQEK